MSAAVYVCMSSSFFPGRRKAKSEAAKGHGRGSWLGVVVLNVGVGEITGKAKGAKTGSMLVAGEGRKRRN